MAKVERDVVVLTDEEKACYKAMCPLVLTRGGNFKVIPLRKALRIPLELKKSRTRILKGPPNPFFAIAARLYAKSRFHKIK